MKLISSRERFLRRPWTRIGPKVVVQGLEAQCPLCGIVFSTDRNCERHKPYSMPKSKTCKSPESVGLEKRLRRDIEVWVQPPPQFVQNLNP